MMASRLQLERAVTTAKALELVGLPAAVVGAGRTPLEAAAQLGVGKETTRYHLKSVFTKTGTGRQAELVALLAGKAVPRSDAE